MSNCAQLQIEMTYIQMLESLEHQYLKRSNPAMPKHNYAESNSPSVMQQSGNCKDIPSTMH